MQTNKIIILSLMINTLSACSSPPTLSEPTGDWISFEPPVPQPPLTHSNLGSLPVTPVSVPLVIQSDASKFILVQDNGKNVPLYKAVRAIVPASWSVKLAPDVAKNYRGNVSWTGNDQWPYVLRKMFSNTTLIADIDDVKKEVVVKFAKPAISPVIPSTPLVTVTSSVKVLQAPIVPVVTQTQVPEQAIVVNPKPILIIKPVPTLKVWKLDKGISLKQGFDLWVSEEKCQAGNGKWHVRWDTDTDYAIDYSLSFTATNFEDATSQLFNLYQKAQAPLYVSGYRNQCLIVISDKK